MLWRLSSNGTGALLPQICPFPLRHAPEDESLPHPDWFDAIPVRMAHRLLLLLRRLIELNRVFQMIKLELTFLVWRLSAMVQRKNSTILPKMGISFR